MLRSAPRSAICSKVLPALVVMEIMEIMRQVATGLPSEQRPLDDGMPGG